MYYIYMLRCIDNSIYTGITTNLEQRMQEHFSGDKKCAKYTKTHVPKKLERTFQTTTRALASKLEYYIKTLTKDQKENLIKNGNLEAVLSEKIDASEYTLYNYEKEQT